MRALPLETNELNIAADALLHARGVLASCTAGGARRVWRRGSSACCAPGLDAAPTPSLKSAWFSALRDTAQTPADARVARARLEEGGEGARAGAGRARLHPPGAGARRPRRARRGRRSSTSRSSASRTPIARRSSRSSGRRSRRRPARARRVVRSRSATSRTAAASRGCSKALRYLHHPLRAAAVGEVHRAEPRLLREIQRTGDIFFPKRWMDATLGGHSSAAGGGNGRGVRRRACRRTTPSACGACILSSADDLFRAQRHGEASGRVRCHEPSRLRRWQMTGHGH